jgi:hypothetical protein
MGRMDEHEIEHELKGHGMIKALGRRAFDFYSITTDLLWTSAEAHAYRLYTQMTLQQYNAPFA